MLKDLTTDHYLTMISGLLDLTSGRLCFAQAGHPYPILHAKEGTFHHIGRDSLPIGISQTARFQDHHLQLALGERLILYSDGFSGVPMAKIPRVEKEGYSRSLPAFNICTVPLSPIVF